MLVSPYPVLHVHLPDGLGLGQRQVEPLNGQRPGGEAKAALLVVEGEPRDVDLARGGEDSRRDVKRLPVAADHHVGLVGGVELVRGGVVQ